MANGRDPIGLDAAKDTLMNIAAVSGVAVMALRPAQTLVADLGLDDNGLAILAEYQARIVARLADGAQAQPPEGERFREDMVWQVLWRTARGREMTADEARDLIAQALHALRASGATPD